MDSASLTAVAAQSKVKDLTAAANTLFTPRVRKACVLFLLLLLLLLLLLCFWFLFPLLTSFISRMSVTKTPSPTKPESRPVITATAPPLPPPAPAPAPAAPQPSTMPPAPVVDPAVVSAAVEAKTQNLLAELLLKQEQLFSQMKERLNLDLQGIKSSLDAGDSDTRLRLQQEVAGLGRKMMEYQTDSRSAAVGLSLRIQAVEAENSKLSQELSSIQLTPPPAPCPETTAAPVQDHLTPELQQAMERWLTDRIKEQDVLRLGDKGINADLGRPMADKMADFALETQGASVISTRCSETYRIRSACVTLFGFPCGIRPKAHALLFRVTRITHVTLDHLPRCNSPTGRIDSAPKDFEVYGATDDTEEGTLLGTFTYDEEGESTQTFQLLKPSEEVYRFVELRVLSNWGHVEYTCLYRFRVHGKMASTT
ncbi:unnamed protein product [Pleuronectes platessa]|uniref:SUN domain-containing protein n=1 Tax=Pleuronectes platessa TaxID=8262 RepID=A0A9N7YSQ1_PLEPL|nr:unnamed protein product [Pleuronectes platessa]